MIQYQDTSAPLVSVCISSYNSARFICDAVDSALRQEHQPIEVVISDNGSTDDTRAQLARYSDEPRVKIISNSFAVDIVVNTNRCIEHARGEYIVILSADGCLYPTHVRACLERLLDRSDPVDLVYSGAIQLDSVGEPSASLASTGLLQMDYSLRNEFAETLMNRFLCLSTFLVPARIYAELGMLAPTFTRASDRELLLRFAAAGTRFAYLAEPLAAVRPHDGESLVEYLDVLEKYLTDETAWRVAGYEYRIKRSIETRYGNAIATALSATGDSYAHRINSIMANLKLPIRAASLRPSDVPRVTIIMTTAGTPALLSRAMQCLARQTFRSWEVVVVQNYGTNLGSFLKHLPECEKIRYVRNDSFMTPAVARNCALQLARGEYVTYLDDDNTISADHLEVLVTALDASGADAAISGSTLAIDDLVPALPGRRATKARFNDIFRATDDRRVSFLAHALPLDSIMHKLAVIDRIGAFREDFAMLEDWEFILRIEHSHQLHCTGVISLNVHEMVALKDRPAFLAAPHTYLQVMEAIYKLYPAPTAEIAGLRQMYSVELVDVFSDIGGRAASLEGTVDVLYRLSGRHARFSQPLSNANDAVLVGAL